MNTIDKNVKVKTNNTLDNMPKWKRILFYIAVGLGGILFVGIMRKNSENQNKKRKLREKVRYFKPTIIEGDFGISSISWEMRDIPLSDEQLDDFMKYEKYM